MNFSSYLQSMDYIEDFAKKKYFELGYSLPAEWSFSEDKGTWSILIKGISYDMSKEPLKELKEYTELLIGKVLDSRGKSGSHIESFSLRCTCLCIGLEGEDDLYIPIPDLVKIVGVELEGVLGFLGESAKEGIDYTNDPKQLFADIVSSNFTIVTDREYNDTANNISGSISIWYHSKTGVIITVHQQGDLILNRTFFVRTAGLDVGECFNWSGGSGCWSSRLERSSFYELELAWALRSHDFMRGISSGKSCNTFYNCCSRHYTSYLEKAVLGEGYLDLDLEELKEIFNSLELDRYVTALEIGYVLKGIPKFVKFPTLSLEEIEYRRDDAYFAFIEKFNSSDNAQFYASCCRRLIDQMFM